MKKNVIELNFLDYRIRKSLNVVYRLCNVRGGV